MPWFLEDPDRLKVERIELEKLYSSADWLVGYQWNINKGLCVNAILCAHGHNYELEVSFPAFFPSVPIIVRPQNVENRLSEHQYGGADGPLCLEWGPDNWHEKVTAAQMLESAYRLFDLEDPLGKVKTGRSEVAPSRHQLTIGQELRFKLVRWYCSAAVRDFFKNQPSQSIGSFRFSLRTFKESWTVTLHEITPLGGNSWRDPQFPKEFPDTKEDYHYVGIWFKTDLVETDIGKPDTLEKIIQLLSAYDSAKFLATDGSSPIEGFNRVICGIIICDKFDQLHLFHIIKGETAGYCTPVVSAQDDENLRAPDRAILSNKKIGIVGMGSAGSKIAVTLTRMGCQDFYLIDHDIFLPENIKRHALDWQSVTQHKVDAVEIAICQINPKAKIEVSRVHLTGQESNAVVSGAVNPLKSCDLIIDATASSRVFNLLSTIVKSEKKTFIWFEIYGGGIGGMIARSRPGKDLSPQDMRLVYLKFCEDNPAPDNLRVGNNYDLEEGGEVISASDSDVSIVAHHVARFVPDCFVPVEDSRFPYSMYLVGMSKGWVFEEPFYTIPISCENFSISNQDETNEVKLDQDTIQFLKNLFEDRDKNEPSSSS